MEERAGSEWNPQQLANQDTNTFLSPKRMLWPAMAAKVAAPQLFMHRWADIVVALLPPTRGSKRVAGRVGAALVQPDGKTGGSSEGKKLRSFSSDGRTMVLSRSSPRWGQGGPPGVCDRPLHEPTQIIDNMVLQQQGLPGAEAAQKASCGIHMCLMRQVAACKWRESQGFGSMLNIQIFNSSHPDVTEPRPFFSLCMAQIIHQLTHASQRVSSTVLTPMRVLAVSCLAVKSLNKSVCDRGEVEEERKERQWTATGESVSISCRWSRDAAQPLLVLLLLLLLRKTEWQKRSEH
ncbi:unnamed protein product [Pleuronectes platessa]|uniref:Uncharacterized protein n=1 Tax=Pleuronectes platessa TaxID=8262 RepID=A0A9N7UN47_PLEPL|nr:unnamed protein product [Pleuronectes platessa]